MPNRLVAAVAVAGVVAATAGTAQARDQINIVGSSTVYPFATVVAENFGRGSEFKTPKIESTGSGGGMKLFCAGLGTDHPDITNASRRMKSSELTQCRENGVQNVVEVKIGYDGIVMANAKGAPAMQFTLRQLFPRSREAGPRGQPGRRQAGRQPQRDVGGCGPDASEHCH